MHPEIVSRNAQQVIEIARRFGASGWKLNGAGGFGGSVSILCGPAAHAAEEMAAAIEAASPRFRMIPVRLDAQGLRVSVN